MTAVLRDYENAEGPNKISQAAKWKAAYRTAHRTDKTYHNPPLRGKTEWIEQ